MNRKHQIDVTLIYKKNIELDFYARKNTDITVNIHTRKSIHSFLMFFI